MKWRVIIELDSETGDWAVWCPELPGCVSAGETESEDARKYSGSDSRKGSASLRTTSI